MSDQRRLWCACFQAYQPDRSVCESKGCPIVNLSARAMSDDATAFMAERGIKPWADLVHDHVWEGDE